MNRAIISKIIIITCLITFINLSSVIVTSKQYHRKYPQQQSTFRIHSTLSNTFKDSSSVIGYPQNSNTHKFITQNDQALINSRLLQPCTIDKCDICTNVNVNICEKCLSTYYIVVVSPNIGTCSSCSNNFSPSDHCKQCQQNIDNTFKCRQCQDSFYIMNQNTNQCQSCSQLLTHCYTCTYTNQFHCIQCDASYYLKQVNNKSSCQLCSSLIENCNTCEVTSNLQSCNQCEQPYQQDYLGQKCFKCDVQVPGCSLCEDPTAVNTPKLCIQCKSGYLLNNKICTPCTIQNCKDCILENNVQFCTQCIDDTYYYDIHSQKCLKCNTLTTSPYNGHCLQCQVNANDVIQCQVCQSGFVVEGQSNIGCQACNPNIVGSNCLECTSDNKSVTLCSLCKSGFYLLNNGASCQGCNKDIILPLTTCIECATDGISNLCKKCKPGYLPSSDSKKCETCSQSMPNCISCNNDQNTIICTGCSNNQFLKVLSNGCDECSNVIPNCNSCQNVVGITKCKKCDDTLSPKKYVDNLDRLTCKICQQVISQCQTCTNDNGVVGVTTCVSCKENYYVTSDSKQCKPCSQAFIGCFNCNNNNGVTKCLGCTNPNYLSLDQKQCTACFNIFSNCDQCSNNNGITKCTKCKSDFLLKDDGSGCIPCSPTVASCTKCSGTVSTPVCTACSNLLVPNFQKNGCIDCPTLIKNCTSCSVDSNGATTCSVCQNNLIPELDKRLCSLCQRIISNCKTCTTTNTGTTTCIACSDTSYPKSSTQCLNCSTINSECTSCTAETITVSSISKVVGRCQQCTTRFIPSNNYCHCKPCSFFISNCSQCSYIKQPRFNKCTSCNIVDNQQLYPRVGQISDSCLPCNQNIVRCKTCFLQSGVTKCSQCLSSQFVPNTQKTSCIIKT